MEEGHKYKISLDPRILELLGPSLYTNIYYVLAELIANAYDADASNVYIIQKKNSIIVEDDGEGMSYNDGDVNKYLNVAVETRTTKSDIYTLKGTRRRMGRKGVGKLAALSVSEKVKVMTKKNNEKSGFILSRQIGPDNELEPINEKNIVFERVGNKLSGTSIVMENPEYGMHKTATVIKKNLLKIFPLVNSQFVIHIITEKDEAKIDGFDKEMISELGALIIIGEEYHHLAKYYKSGFSINEKEREKELLVLQKSFIKELKLKNRSEEEETYKMEIKGWVGAYRSTRGRKADRDDFPDNFISLISNGKLGEYNILSHVGRNKLQEVFVVGQLHVDLFEETELPDMALSNRQGYKDDDKRYRSLIEYVRNDLLPDIVRLRTTWASFNKDDKTKEKLEMQRKREEELRQKVEEYKTKASEKAAVKITGGLRDKTTPNIKEIIHEEMNRLSPIIGLKRRVDSQKKKILISHTKADKDLSDIIYSMLVFNNVPDDNIIYTSSDNENCWIPENINMFDYLRDFFVDSISNEKIYVIYVTSEKMSKSWFAVTEVGAVWITRRDHKIFNLQDHNDTETYSPKKPLNVDAVWQTSKRTKDGAIVVSTVEFNRFIKKINDICNYLGYNPKGKAANDKELRRYVNVI